MFITRLLAILISCYLATLCEGNPFLATFRRYTKLKCSTKKCSNVHACVVVHGVETCVCSHSCRHSIRTGPLCGTDGMTYTHLCHLRRKECYTRKFITVKHYGKCQGPCKDAKRESTSGLCKSWASSGACLNNPDYMKEYCAATCGLCKFPAPKIKPKCADSQYGCCYASIQPATGPNEEGCLRKCQDERWCNYFIGNCGDYINKVLMKYRCPVTCRYCDPNRKNRKT